MSQLDYPKRLLLRPQVAFTLLRESLEPKRGELQELKNLIAVLSPVAKAYGIKRLANETGIKEATIYQTLRRNEVNLPTFTSLIKIMHAMGLRFSIGSLLDYSEYSPHQIYTVQILRGALEPQDGKPQDLQSFSLMLSHVARTYGIEKLASETGIEEFYIYRVLRNQVTMPTLRNLIKILNAMGMRLSVEPLSPKGINVHV